MTNLDLALIRAQKALARQDYERGNFAGQSSGGAFDSAGPPTWNRDAWEAFRQQYGFYPFGRQNGTMVRPPTMDGAPGWVWELMGERRPPITVTSV